MTDNLRTRIAAAISGVDDWRGVTDPEILADAVIRELKLHVVIVGDFQTVIKGSYPTPLEEPNG